MEIFGRFFRYNLVWDFRFFRDLYTRFRSVFENFEDVVKMEAFARAIEVYFLGVNILYFNFFVYLDEVYDV